MSKMVFTRTLKLGEECKFVIDPLVGQDLVRVQCLKDDVQVSLSVIPFEDALALENCLDWTGYTRAA